MKFTWFGLIGAIFFGIIGMYLLFPPAQVKIKTEMLESPKEDRTVLCTLRTARLANTVDPRRYSADPMLEYYKECLDEKK